MTLLNRIVGLYLVAVVVAFGQPGIAQEPSADSSKTDAQTQIDGNMSSEEILALLDSIDPYLPNENVSGEIDIFGSTSMDVLAHGWATEFKKFHSDSTVVISAEGSETVIDRMTKNQSSIGMLSRPVSNEDLAKLKTAGLKHPVAIQVAREPLGVFVNKSNPLEVINYEQLVSLFCAEDPAAQVNWTAVGIGGELAEKPIHIIGRDDQSGTRHFIETYLFHLNKMRPAKSELSSNAEVIQAVAKDTQAIAISDYKFNNKSVRRLKLREKSVVIEGNEHEILLGHYPITRPLTLVFDLEAKGNQAKANREFVRYTLSQSGQANTILAGFFPFDPPTLRGELSKLEIQKDQK